MNLQSIDGVTALHTACHRGYTRIVRCLMAEGFADLEVRR